MPRNPRRISAVSCSAVVVLLVSSACGGTESTDSGGPQPTASSTTAGYPVSIENCGRTLTFDSAPERVVSLWQAPTEMMFALGLQDRISAMAGNYTGFSEDLAGRAAGIEEIGTSMAWPSKEVVLSQGSDLVIGQVLDGFAFDTSQGLASVEQIESGGTQVYGANSCTTPGTLEMTVDTPSQTLQDLGAMFDVRDRANRLVSDMAAQKQKIVDAVAGRPIQKVAYFSGGQGPLLVLAGGIYDDAITTAGGTNVFPKDSIYVSKEEFAASDADVILVGTYDGQDLQSQRDFLTENFPDIPAVKNGRISEVPVDDTDASVTVMTGLAKIAAALHSDADIDVPGK